MVIIENTMSDQLRLPKNRGAQYLYHHQIREQLRELTDYTTVPADIGHIRRRLKALMQMLMTDRVNLNRRRHGVVCVNRCMQLLRPLLEPQYRDSFKFPDIGVDLDYGGGPPISRDEATQILRHDMEAVYTSIEEVNTSCLANFQAIGQRFQELTDEIAALRSVVGHKRTHDDAFALTGFEVLPSKRNFQILLRLPSMKPYPRPGTIPHVQLSLLLTASLLKLFANANGFQIKR